MAIKITDLPAAPDGKFRTEDEFPVTRPSNPGAEGAYKQSIANRLGDESIEGNLTITGAQTVNGNQTVTGTSYTNALDIDSGNGTITSVNNNPVFSNGSGAQVTLDGDTTTVHNVLKVEADSGFASEILFSNTDGAAGYDATISSRFDNSFILYNTHQAPIKGVINNVEVFLGNYDGTNKSFTVRGLTETETLKVTTGAAAGKVLKSDADGNATWQTDSTGGDVVGPSSPVVASNLAAFDTTTGKLIKDAGVSTSQITTNANNIATNATAIAAKLDEANSIFRAGYSKYCADGRDDLATVINSITNEGTIVNLSSGSFGGTTPVTINKNNICIFGPPSTPGLVEFLHEITTASTADRIRMRYIMFDADFTAAAKRSTYNHCSFTENLSIETSATPGYMTFANCGFAAEKTISVQNTFASVIYFINCNFSGCSFSLNQATSQQVIFSNCGGFTSFPANATYAGINTLTSGYIQNTVTKTELASGSGTAGQVLTSGGANTPDTWTTPAEAGGTYFAFTSSTTHTVPDGKTKAVVTVIGSGGGGSGSGASQVQSLAEDGIEGAGGGGGAGGQMQQIEFNVVEGLDLTITIGSAGTGGAGQTTSADPQNGGAGGSCSLRVTGSADTILSSAGGLGGNAAQVSGTNGHITGGQGANGYYAGGGAGGGWFYNQSTGVTTNGVAGQGGSGTGTDHVFHGESGSGHSSGNGALNNQGVAAGASSPGKGGAGGGPKTSSLASYGTGGNGASAPLGVFNWTNGNAGESGSPGAVTITYF